MFCQHLTRSRRLVAFAKQHLEGVGRTALHDYEFLIIDNASDDGTIELTGDLSGDSRIKAIINQRTNTFTPFYGVLQAHGR